MLASRALSVIHEVLMGTMSRIGRRLALAITGLAIAVLDTGEASAQATSGPPVLTLQQHFAEAATIDHGFDINDKKAVFAFVFKNLPERAKVWPTEHYFYFKFMHRGLAYSGNLRFERELRDQGKLHFAYALDFTDFMPPGDTQHQLFEKKDGIDLERVDDWTYRLTYEGKSVTFELNKMEGVKPPASVIAADEKYLGPIFDESAVRFFLVYNSKLKQFLYILDETGAPTDGLVTSPTSDRILLGQRTGFAFYRDHKLDRRILIGVFDGNVRINNYYDGPFDQLPDDFLEGDVLRDAILEIDPSYKGKIDRYGSSFDGEERYMIAPYLQYNEERELAIFHRCATNKRIPAEQYYACFALVNNGETDKPMLAAERNLKGEPNEPRRRRGR